MNAAASPVFLDTSTRAGLLDSLDHLSFHVITCAAIVQLERIVERALAERPTNAVAFMIDMLCEGVEPTGEVVDDYDAAADDAAKVLTRC